MAWAKPEANVELVEALLLGIVQGLTEFLPVSSSGHLVLLQHLFGWGQLPLDSILTFDTTVHLGTLLAVVAVFWRDLLDLLKGWWQGLRQGRPLETTEARLAWWIILGTVPAVLAGLLLEKSFERIFGSPRAVGGFLLLTALLLALGEWRGRRERDLDTLTWLDSLLIGIGQAAAIAPGLSRSGATIATGMLRGLKRETSARFSFLLSMPIIAGTGLLQLARLILSDNGEIPALVLLVGFLAAAVSGYAAIRFLLNYVRRRPLYPFALYCVVVGLLTIVLLGN